MFNEFLERLFARSKDKDSRSEVKRRLKLLLAHDRADLPPAIVESMQEEILEVISRYVELDREGLSFSLESDRRTTALTANFPILRVKDDSEEENAPQQESQENLENSNNLETQEEETLEVAVENSAVEIPEVEIPEVENPTVEIPEVENPEVENLEIVVEENEEAEVSETTESSQMK
ncbi:MAG: cell division topological specificity factor MinE [Geitlerinemataceae cyanobacterium]